MNSIRKSVIHENLAIVGSQCMCSFLLFSTIGDAIKHNSWHSILGIGIPGTIIWTAVCWKHHMSNLDQQEADEITRLKDELKRIEDN